MKQSQTVVSRTAFTLVELVIVVMIVGILVAIAAPKFLDVSATVTDHGLRQTLSVVRDATEKYLAEHGGALPGADADPLTFRTDLAPYLQDKFPRCPVGPARNSKIRMVGGAGPISGMPDPVRGWRYNYETGQFIVNWNQPTETYPNINYDEL